MNFRARLNWNGFRGEIANPGCGRMAMENHAIAFWQSRMARDGAVPDVLQLTDIPALAIAVRTTPANADNL